MERTSPIDIAIIGAGPAGLSLASALAGHGLDILLVDKRDGPWPQTYGAFADQLEDLGVASAIAHRWERPLVHTGAGQIQLDRTYALVNNERLRRLLDPRDRIRRMTAEVRHVSESDSGCTVRFDDDSIDARIVIDASGGALEPRSAVRSAQVALGLEVELESNPWGPGECLWMDLRCEAADVPSFLYALPLGGNRVLLEETSLASRPPLPIPVLRRRLMQRITQLGLKIRHVEREEEVFIPLDRPLAAPRTASMRFGAAGGFVHPSTGYSLVRSLRTAPVVAAALADGLATATPRRAVKQGWAAAWSTKHKATRALHLAGLEVLLSLDTAKTQRFFDAFFALAPEHQAAWLNPTGHPGRVASAMAHLFGRAPSGVRADVLFAALDQLDPGLSLSTPRTGGSP